MLSTGERIRPKFNQVMLVVLILGLVSVLSSVGVTGSPLATRHGSVSVASLAGAGPLARAEASLARGSGPALGSALHCRSDGADSARCATPAVSPALRPAGGYLWNNITPLVGTAPTGGLASMAWDGSDGYVLFFEGAVGSGVSEYLNDTWTYANGTWTNITASTSGAPPPGLYLEGLAWDPSSAEVVLFGGYSEVRDVDVGYTWVYHAKTWTNLTSALATAPSAREIPAMSTDTTDGQVILYGGDSNTGFVGDTWTFHDDAWTNITSAQSLHLPVLLYPVVSDYPGHGALLLGGFNDSGVFVTFTYVFAAGDWTNLTPAVTTSPPPPGLGYAAYLPSVPGVLEIAGIVFQPDGSTVVAPVAWLWSGTSWANVTGLIGFVPDAYSPLAATAAYVPTDQSIVTFGGERAVPPTFGNYTWVLCTAPSVTAHLDRSPIDVGQAATFSATVSGGLDPNSVAWTFGDGGESSNLTQSHTYPAAGIYTATLTVTDLAGASSSSSVSEDVNPDPAVVIDASNATAGSSVGLAAVVTGGTGPFVYSWKLGDGATSSAAFVTHTYAHAGVFTVSVSVTDAAGFVAQDSVEITVAAPSSGVDLTSGTGLYLVLGMVGLLVLTVVFLLLWIRKPKIPRGAPTPYGGPTPPPGASGPSPPPGIT